MVKKTKINITTLLPPRAEKERKGREIHDFFKQEGGQDDGGNSGAGANSGGGLSGLAHQKTAPVDNAMVMMGVTTGLLSTLGAVS